MQKEKKSEEKKLLKDIGKYSEKYSKKDIEKLDTTMGLNPPDDSLSFDLTLRISDLDEGFEGQGREIATIIKKKIGIKELKYLVKNIKLVVESLDTEATAELEGKDDLDQDYRPRG